MLIEFQFLIFDFCTSTCTAISKTISEPAEIPGRTFISLSTSKIMQVSTASILSSSTTLRVRRSSSLDSTKDYFGNRFTSDGRRFSYRL